MPKRNRNTFSCMDDVPGVPTGTGEAHLAGSMNRVKDIPVDPIVVHAACPVPDIPADSDDENIDCADDVPDIPTPFDDVNSTLPDATAGVKHP